MAYDSIRSELYCFACFSVSGSCRLRLYLTSRSDRNQSDPFRRNPLVRNPMQFGWVSTGFYWESDEFRSNPMSSPTVSDRIYRSDWTTWDRTRPDKNREDLYYGLMYVSSFMNLIWTDKIRQELCGQFIYVS